MRCNDCNKFVSFDDSTEPEAEIEIDEDGQISGTVRIVLTCAECGTELKESNFDVSEEADIEDGHGEKRGAIEETADGRWMVLYDGIQAGGQRDLSGSGDLTFATKEEAEKYEDSERMHAHGDFEVEVDEVELTSRTQTTDKHGKPIRNRRYMRTFYGFQLSYSVKCSCGEEVASGTIEDETQASGMDELT